MPTSVSPIEIATGLGSDETLLIEDKDVSRTTVVQEKKEKLRGGERYWRVYEDSETEWAEGPRRSLPLKKLLAAAFACVGVAVFVGLFCLAQRQEADDDSHEEAEPASHSVPLNDPSSTTQNTPKNVELFWTATAQRVNFDGVTVHSYGINGGNGHDAIIDANTGDRIILHFTNNLTVPTALHFHGLSQNSSGFMDGPTGVTQCPIAPGRSYVYNFTIDDQVGSFFWHAHYGLQSIDGLRGPFIIHDRNENVPKYDTEHLIQLSDWYHEPSQSLSDWYLSSKTNPDGNEPVFQSGLINGIGQFNCTAIPGRPCTQKTPYVLTIAPKTASRLRVMNTGTFAAFLFSIDGHELTVVEVDGVTVEPYVVDMISLNVAQRYSVIVRTNRAPSNFQIRASMYHGDTWTSMPEMPIGFNPHVTAILNYSPIDPAEKPLRVTPPPHPRILDDTNLSPTPSSVQFPTQPSADVTVLYEFNFETRATDLYQKAYNTLHTLSTNNTWTPLFTSSFQAPKMEPLLVSAHDLGHGWNPDPAASTIFLARNQVVDVMIRNNDPGEHPFHIHGHDFWILSTGVTNSVSKIPRALSSLNPVRRDVVTVAACPHDLVTSACLPANATVDAATSKYHVFSETVEGTPYPVPSGQDDVWFGYAVIRFVANNPGVWLMHCHITFHLEAGLGITFVESMYDIQQLEKPGVVAQTCGEAQQWLNEGNVL
ncbi:hypothetical protein CcCBS67573_g07214 [Chytriomyces confervae]|uniref:Multicopper oxidase n=1 Tax=Chytriomyces confervae TaxID=246404 RepID=A0A507EW83_9FUNG|nr:hypothetical protein CcCBS67573_g07214 [Chytriomyces confervae]